MAVIRHPFYAQPHAEELCRYAAHGARGAGEKISPA